MMTIEIDTDEVEPDELQKTINNSSWIDFISVAQCYSGAARIPIDQDRLWDEETQAWYPKEEVIKEICEDYFPWKSELFTPDEESLQNLYLAKYYLQLAIDKLEE